ncbi:MAG: hypothetical protein ACREQN_08865 [Candidatus Binataceae bacterium]
MERLIMHKPFKALMRGLFVLCLGAGLPSCGGAFGVGNSNSPGNTPSVSTQVSFRIIGAVGTPFTAIISDRTASWQIRSVIPLSIVVVNTQYPARMTVTKTVNDSSLLSAEIIKGFNVAALSSTSAPFGKAVVGVNGQLSAFAPPANPDIRFYVNGPNTAVYDALVEQGKAGQVVQSRAPSVLLFDTFGSSDPAGRVDGIFNIVSFIGGFDIDLSYNGMVVKSAAGGTSVTLKFP